jgi:hypothetical protein
MLNPEWRRQDETRVSGRKKKKNVAFSEASLLTLCFITSKLIDVEARCLRW